ncbi:hypothetical protein [Cupriavidus gilardii]|uniref:hypothetical protein n=1 Tax=Cupriavidus gilardii TaxID=82541 RepID=UPI0021C031A5|nr:hypothetical protein [Cupriavidus gilardii]MCT9127505.1 hypothetical protein [Cupriavidus gilardii]
MNAIRELVTVLRYQVDQSGLRKYQTAYRTALGKIGAGVRNVRDFGLGFVDGVRQGIGEVMAGQRALNAAQAQGTREVQQMGQGYRHLLVPAGELVALAPDRRDNISREALPSGDVALIYVEAEELANGTLQ